MKSILHPLQRADVESRAAGAVRMTFRDNALTYDQSMFVVDQNSQVHPGQRLAYGNGGTGGVRTHDGRTVDSTGAFLVGELERLDPTLHEPLASVTWSRDIDMREDATMADEVTSFTLSTYGSPGGLGAGNSIGNGKAWMGKTSDQIGNVSIDIAKIVQPLRLWGLEMKFTIPELESAAKLGRPIDNQKFQGLQLKHQMDIDEQVYMGDTSTGDTGLLNATLMTNINNVVAGANGTTAWTTKTPDEILTDFNSALASVWAASAWAVIPSRILLPPAQFGYISTQKVSLAGNVSILKYVQENNLLTTSGKGKLDILPCKWCIGMGAGGTIGTAGIDRMFVYTKDQQRVRYPMTPLQRTTIQYEGLYHKTTYFCRLGRTELVYPETVGAFDGI